MTVYSPEGYDADVLEDLGPRIEGFYFQAAFRPFEAREGSDGMEEYLAATEWRDQTPNEHSLVGWVEPNNEADLTGVPSIDDPVYL